MIGCLVPMHTATYVWHIYVKSNTNRSWTQGLVITNAQVEMAFDSIQTDRLTCEITGFQGFQETQKSWW